MATGFLDFTTSMIGVNPYVYVDYWQEIRVPSDCWHYWYNSVPAFWTTEIKYFTEVFEMYVYNIILVDTEKCRVIEQYLSVVAESEKMAMLEIVMSPDLKELLKKGKLKVIFNQVGGFDRFKKSEE